MDREQLDKGFLEGLFSIVQKFKAVDDLVLTPDESEALRDMQMAVIWAQVMGWANERLRMGG
jgi:hypothetical protein